MHVEVKDKLGSEGGIQLRTSTVIYAGSQCSILTLRDRPVRLSIALSAHSTTTPCSDWSDCLYIYTLFSAAIIHR